MNKHFFFTRCAWALILFAPAIEPLAQDTFQPSLVWKGDLRVRQVNRYTQNSSDNQNYRLLMARLGLVSKPTEKLEAEFRVATGTGRQSTNAELGSSTGENLSLRLDRASASYKALIQEHSSLNVVAGRSKNIFASSVSNDLLFDSDLNFDLLAAQYAHKGESSEWTLTLANTLLASGKDASLLDRGDWISMHSAHAQAKWSPGPVSWSAYVGAHVATDADRIIVGSASYNNAAGSNATVSEGSATRFANELKILSTGLEAGFKIQEMPWAIGAEWLTNTAKNASDNSAYWIGFRGGSTNNVGGYSLGYDFRNVQANSVFAPFADGDSANSARSNYRSHRIRLAYAVDKGLVVGTNLFFGKRNIRAGQTKLTANMVHLDLNYVF